MDPACTQQECVRWLLCDICRRRFATDERDRTSCYACEPPTDDTWVAFRPK